MSDFNQGVLIGSCIVLVTEVVVALLICKRRRR